MHFYLTTAHTTTKTSSVVRYGNQKTYPQRDSPTTWKENEQNILADNRT